MSRRFKVKNRYTAISYVFIAMGLVMIFMMSDVSFEERNNLTLVKAAVTIETNGKGYYDGIVKYDFMMTKVSDEDIVFTEYMDKLDFVMTDAITGYYYYEHDNGLRYRVKRTIFLSRYYLWEFEDLDKKL